MKNKIFKKFIALMVISVMFLGSMTQAFAQNREISSGNTLPAHDLGISLETIPAVEEKIPLQDIVHNSDSTISLDSATNNLIASDKSDAPKNVSDMNRSIHGNPSSEAQYVLNATDFLLSTSGHIEGLDGYAHDDMVNVLVWLQELPLAQKAIYEAEGLYVPGLAEAEAEARTARSTINGMAGARNSRSSGGTTIRGEFFGVFAGFSLTTTMATALEIAALPGVHAVTKEAVFYLPPVEAIEFSLDNYIPDPDYLLPGNGSGREIGRIGELHAMGIDGTGIKIAVIDDGMMMNHPDLSNAVSGYNFANRTTNLWTGVNDHGTHVAGTVGSTGQVLSLGVAPGAELYNGMVFAVASGSAFQADILAALEVFSGFPAPPTGFPGLAGLNLPKVDVINMSLGNQSATEYGNGSWERNNAVLAGVTVVNSAGNGAHVGTNTTHRNNYTVGSGGAMLSISVASAQFGSHSSWVYSEAEFDGSQFELFVENSDASFSGLFAHGWFGNPEAHYQLFDAAFVSGNPPWLEPQYFGTYHRQPIEFIDGLGYELYWASPSLADMNDHQMAVLKTLPADSLIGKLLVVNRGQAFSDYMGEALRLGAAGIIVLNREPSLIGNMNIANCPAQHMLVLSAPVGARQVLLDAYNAAGGDPVFLMPGDRISQHYPKRPASSSSIGPTHDNAYIKPDITAPGANIMSTISVDNGYTAAWGLKGGTSMSSPYVAGVAALLIQHLKAEGISYTPAEIRARLMATSDPFLISPFEGRFNNEGGYFFAGGTESSVWEQGSGFVNPHRALFDGVYFLIEHDYPTGHANREHAMGDFSSLSYSVMPVNGQKTLTARVFGLDNYALDVIYMHETRYSNRNLNHDVTVSVQQNGNTFDSTINIGPNAVSDDRFAGNLYEGYVKVTDLDSGREFFIPWGVRVEGTLITSIDKVDVSITAPRGGRVPQTNIDGSGFVGTINWSPNHEVFEWETDYIASVMLTPKEAAGYFTEDVVINVPGAGAINNIVNTGDTLAFDVFYSSGEETQTAVITIDYASDIWGDGSGYQLWIEDNEGDVLKGVQSIRGAANYWTLWNGIWPHFLTTMDYWVPENATPGPHGIFVAPGNSQSIEIPAGTYDFVVTNPDGGPNYWIASDNSPYSLNIGYDFEAGYEYKFGIILVGSNDFVTLEVTPISDIILDEVTVQITEPTAGRAPQTSVEGRGFEGTVAWYPDHSAFQWNTDYVASVTLVPSQGSITFADYIEINVPGSLNIDNINIAPTLLTFDVFYSIGEQPGMANIIVIDATGNTNVNLLGFDSTLQAIDLWLTGAEISILHTFDQHVPAIEDMANWTSYRFQHMGEGQITAGTHDLFWWTWSAFGPQIPFWLEYTFEADKTYIIELLTLGAGQGNGTYRIIVAEPHLESFTVNRNTMNMMGGKWTATATGYFEEDIEYQVFLDGELFEANVMTGTSMTKAVEIVIPENQTGIDQVYEIHLPFFEGEDNYSPQTLVVSGEQLGFAQVTFTIGNPYNDGSGYIMLLDSENKPHVNSFSNYDIHIPENAAQGGVIPVHSSSSIMVPEGTYAIHTSNVDFGLAWNFDVLRFSNYEIEAGYHYHFQRFQTGASNMIIEVTPIVAPETQIVTFSAVDNIGGIVTAFVGSQEIQSGDKVPKGSNVMFVATPYKGYELQTWLMGFVSGRDGGAPSGIPNTLTVNNLRFDLDVQGLFKKLPVQPDSIVIEPSAANVAQGESLQFTAVVLDQFGELYEGAYNITWSINNIQGAVIDQNGLLAVGPLVPANTTIVVTATIDGTGIHADADVTVTHNPIPSTIEVVPAAALVPRGGSHQFETIVYDQWNDIYQGTVLWSVTGLPGITIGQNGLLTVAVDVPVGTEVTVKAEIGDLYAESHVTVTGARFTVNFGEANIGVGTVTASINGVPINSGDAIDENAIVTFTATPAPGYIWAGWDIDFPDANPINNRELQNNRMSFNLQLNIVADIIVNAIFLEAN